MAIAAETRFTSATGDTITGLSFDDASGIIEIWQENIARKGKRQVVRIGRETVTPDELASFCASMTGARKFILPNSDDTVDAPFEDDDDD